MRRNAAVYVRNKLLQIYKFTFICDSCKENDSTVCFDMAKNRCVVLLNECVCVCVCT